MSAAAAKDLAKLVADAAGPLRELTQRLVACRDRLDQLDVERNRVERLPVDAGTAMGRLQADIDALSEAYAAKTAGLLMKAYSNPGGRKSPLRLLTRTTPQGNAVVDDAAVAFFFGGAIVKALGAELESRGLESVSDARRAAALQRLDDEITALRVEIVELEGALKAAGARVR
jgi:hypothetical protein